ncbi:MAG: chemotaxis protein CheW [Gallionella sp.]|nr:chemotaxis protein CheW [Gallionella sp.]MDP1941422.1 chemotaxis protein CheW [Gallionella sp.]
MQDKNRKGGHLSLLGVQVSGQNYLIEMPDISEVLPLLPLTHVPLTKPWFNGIANVRGTLYCVADLAGFLGKGKASGVASNRLLLVANRYDINAALLVDRVFGLRDTGNWRCDAAQPDCYFDEHDTAWHLLNVTALLKQPDFLQIGL